MGKRRKQDAAWDVMKLFLIIWIKLKCFFGVSHLVEDELKFVKKHVKIPEYDWLRVNGCPYKQDLLFGVIPFDFQFDSIDTFAKNGADCNSIHRVIQCYLHNKGYKAYLITAITRPFKLSHTTVIVKTKDGFYYGYDYGYKGKICASMSESIKIITESYGAKKVRAFVCQDINWKVVNVK